MARRPEIRVESMSGDSSQARKWKASYESTDKEIQYDGKWWLITGLNEAHHAGGGRTLTFTLRETNPPE